MGPLLLNGVGVQELELELRAGALQGPGEEQEGGLVAAMSCCSYCGWTQFSTTYKNPGMMIPL